MGLTRPAARGTFNRHGKRYPYKGIPPRQGFDDESRNPSAPRCAGGRRRRLPDRRRRATRDRRAGRSIFRRCDGSRNGAAPGTPQLERSTADSSRRPRPKACSSPGGCSPRGHRRHRDRADRTRLRGLPRRQRVGTVTDSTNFVDPAGTATSRYRVAAVVNGAEVERRRRTPWAQGYLDIPLHKPADGVTPPWARRTRTRPTTCRVGDVDGDGQYEYIVKWDPSNSKDVSQVGYTGQRLRRRLRAGRHAAVAHRPRREHPRRRALHAVPRLRLRR